MSYIQQLKNLCTAYCDAGIKCKQNESMANHVSMKTGGNAALVVWPNSRRQLIQVLNLWREAGSHCPIRVIGAGNQILFSDRGYHGLVVITTNVNRVVFEEDEAEDRESFRREQLFCQVYAECGASLTALAQACGEDARALSGLEFAYGLPGTVGGATVVNAGAFGSDMERVLVSSEYYDLSTGDIVRLMDDQMDMDYRHIIYMDHPQQIEPEQVGVQTGDYVIIKGTPDVNMVNSPEIEGGKGTIAMCANMIPQVINAEPGLHTMLTLPVPRAILGDMRDRIDPAKKLVK